METLLVALGVGIVCALIGSLVGHRLGLHQGRRDNSRAEINAVADRYHHLRQSARSSGAPALMQCGVLGLRNSAEIEQAIVRIGALGHSDPLQNDREGLQGKNVWHFFQVAQQNHLNLNQRSGLDQAYKLTNNA